MAGVNDGLLLLPAEPLEASKMWPDPADSFDSCPPSTSTRTLTDVNGV